MSCYDEKEIVGTARLIWDHGYIAYLPDVIVAPDYQGHGIGYQMVRKTLAFLRKQLHEGWKIKVVHIATQNREDFYRRFGFRERPSAHGGAGMDLWLSREDDKELYTNG